ncbi:MAG: DUF4340 domain-containing protein [Acidithiobacillales bacterium]
MSTKKLLVLTGVFFALFAFVLFYERNQPTSAERAEAKKRLLDFKPHDVTAVLLDRPGLPKVELKKGPGGTWMVEGDPPGRADTFVADSLVSDLSRLELVGEAETRFDPKQYGLDVPRGQATLVFADGSKRTVTFGKEIPGTDATAASDGTRMGAVRAAPLATLNKPVNEFRSKRLLDTPVSEITKITLVKGPNQIVLDREAASPKAPPGPWRIESPVADLASGAFVERLLSDLSSAQISDFPTVSATDLSRIGLTPPAAVLTLEKGKDVVARIAFGAAKADAPGKIYAREDGLVVVVDDRVEEEIGKELSAFRETRPLPLDVFQLRRVQFESGDLRAGAEQVEGEWRSGGQKVASTLVESLAGILTRAESRGFVAKKDYAAHGIVAGPKAAPLATVEVLGEGDASPRALTFRPASGDGGPPAVAVEVSGRPDALLLDATVLDDLKRAAIRLRDAQKEAPKAVPGATPAETPTTAPGKVPPRSPAKKRPTSS